MAFTKFTHFIETLPNKLGTQHEVCVALRDYLFENVTIFFRKDFSYMVSFVNSRKFETQHVIPKIYSHVIETPPSKSKIQHGVHKT